LGAKVDDIEFNTTKTIRQDSTGSRSHTTTSFDFLVDEPTVALRRFPSEAERDTFIESSFAEFVFKPLGPRGKATGGTSPHGC
jgi:hypothetical protein